MPRLISGTNFLLHFVNVSPLHALSQPIFLFSTFSINHSFTLNSYLFVKSTPHRSLTIDTPDSFPQLIGPFSVSTLLLGFSSCFWCSRPNYTVSQKNCAILTMASTLSILDRFSNFFAAANSDKFPTKSTLVFPSHLNYVAALPLETLKSYNFTLRVCKTHFQCYFLLSIQHISVKCHENMCKDQHYAKYQHFTVCSLTDLN